MCPCLCDPGNVVSPGKTVAEHILRWRAKRNSALVVEIIRGAAAGAKAIRCGLRVRCSPEQIKQVSNLTKGLTKVRDALQSEKHDTQGNKAFHQSNEYKVRRFHVETHGNQP